MAFKFSSRIVVASGVLATTTLYLVTTETFLPNNSSNSLHSGIVAVHLSCLTLICILVFAIRTLVEQYEKMYLEEIKANIEKAGMTKEAKTKADNELGKLRQMSPMSSEASVVRTYLDWMTSIPWKKRSKVRLDLQKAEDLVA